MKEWSWGMTATLSGQTYDAEDRWEIGSVFSIPAARQERAEPSPGPFGSTPHLLYGSGRQALLALLRFGARRFGWTAVHVPAYYCPPVTEALASGLPVLPYDAGPQGVLTPARPGATEVVLAVSYFGAPPMLPGSRSAALIVDATHDPSAPWLAELSGDYVVASLRKTLPLPDGGLLWSPAGRALPPDPGPADEEQQRTAERMLAAMRAKAAWLAGADTDKESYLAEQRRAEQELAGTTISGASRYTRQTLPTLPVARLRRVRAANAHRLAQHLGDLPGCRVQAYPFGVVCVFTDPDRRDAARAALIARRVYPAVLWDLPESAAAAQRDLAGRMLFLPTDFRYGPADMDRVAALCRELPAFAGPTGSVLTKGQAC